DEVVDDQAGDREWDVRDPAPEALAVASLLLRGRRAPPRARSPPGGRSVGSTREAAPRDIFCESGEVFEQPGPVGVRREPRGGDQQLRERTVCERERDGPLP